MTKASSWASFSPSFSFAALGQLRDLQEKAYAAARPNADAAVAIATTQQVSVEGLLDANAIGAAGPSRWLNFGHQPIGTGTFWSNFLPYRLSIEFDSNDEVKKVELAIFLANPHFSFSERDFLPARYSSDGQHLEILAESGGRIGFALRSALAEAETQDDIFSRLSSGLPSGALAAPAGFEAHTVNTLLGRLDLTCRWDSSTEKHLGSWIGFPSGKPTAALGKIARTLSVQLGDIEHRPGFRSQISQVCAPSASRSVKGSRCHSRGTAQASCWSVDGRGGRLEAVSSGLPRIRTGYWLQRISSPGRGR